MSSSRQTWKKSLLVPSLSYVQATPFVTFRLSLLQHLSSPVRLWSFAWQPPATLFRPLYPQQLVFQKGLGAQFLTDCHATGWRVVRKLETRRANACALSRKYPLFRNIYYAAWYFSCSWKLMCDVLTSSILKSDKYNLQLVKTILA